MSPHQLTLGGLGPRVEIRDPGLVNDHLAIGDIGKIGSGGRGKGYGGVIGYPQANILAAGSGKGGQGGNLTGGFIKIIGRRKVGFPFPGNDTIPQVFINIVGAGAIHLHGFADGGQVRPADNGCGGMGRDGDTNCKSRYIKP